MQISDSAGLGWSPESAFLTSSQVVRAAAARSARPQDPWGPGSRPIRCQGRLINRPARLSSRIARTCVLRAGRGSWGGISELPEFAA
jgi:hypothetical protein